MWVGCRFAKLHGAKIGTIVCADIAMRLVDKTSDFGRRYAGSQYRRCAFVHFQRHVHFRLDERYLFTGLARSATSRDRARIPKLDLRVSRLQLCGVVKWQSLVQADDTAIDAESGQYLPEQLEWRCVFVPTRNVTVESHVLAKVGFNKEAASIMNNFEDFANDMRWTLIKNKLYKRYELKLFIVEF